MGWGDVAAAAAGGLHGVDIVQQRDEQRRLEEEKMANARQIADMRGEVQAMIAQMNEGGRNDRWGTPSGNTVATVEGQNSRAAQTDATQRRGQDVTFDLGNKRDVTQRRGQDIGATTARRGQDVSSTTQRRGQDLTDEHYWDSSDRLFQGMQLGDQRARTRDAVDAYSHVVTAGKTNRTGLGAEEPAPIPQFSDWLKGNQQLFAPPPATATPSRRPGTRPPPPVGPRPAAAAPPAAAAGKYAAGQTVKLKSGKTVTIKSINPDGTFTY